MESGVNILVQNFRLVLVRAVMSNSVKIRIRADLLREPVYFRKTESQVDRWKKNGGALINWTNSAFTAHDAPCEHDAIFFVECPADIDQMDKAAQRTTSAAVVWMPPTWRMHYETHARKWGQKSDYLRRAAMDRLERMRQLLEASPELTLEALQKLPAHPAAPATVQSSSAPEPRAAEGHAARTTPGVP